MTTVWWIGRGSSKTVRPQDWANHGVVADAVVWDALNAWSVDESTLTSAQLAVLAADREFKTGQTGPRVFPGPGSTPVQEDFRGSAYAYFIAIKAMYDYIIENGGGGPGIDLPLSWADVDHPSTFPPSAHGHSQSDISGLETALGTFATTTALGNAITALLGGVTEEFNTLAKLKTAIDGISAGEVDASTVSYTQSVPVGSPVNVAQVLDLIFGVTLPGIETKFSDVQKIRPVGYYTPIGKPDGPILQLDTGQVIATFGDSTGGVVSQEIRTTAAGSPPHGVYYQTDVEETVTRMGCQVKWAPNATGALAFVLPVSAWGPPGGHPSGDNSAGADAGVHITFYGNGLWDCGSWDATAGTVTSYASHNTHGRYDNVWDGEFHDVEVWLDGTEMTVRFPDGSFRSFSNAAVADVTSWVIWEQFESNTADVTCVIQNIWVDTQEWKRDSFTATKIDIAKAFAAIDFSQDLEFVLTSGGTKTMTSFSPQIQVPYGTAAHTITLPSDVKKGYKTTIKNTSTGVVTVNSPTGTFVTAIAANGKGEFTAYADNPTLASNWEATLLATINGVENLTQKTLTAPKITNNGFIADNNGNEQIVFGTTASAINEFKVTNGAAGTGPTLASQGGDANVDFNAVTKGTGAFKVNGNVVLPSIDEDSFVSDLDTRVPTQQSTKAYVASQIAALIGAAPAELDTWMELVSAITSNEDALAGITSSLAGKQDIVPNLTAWLAILAGLSDNTERIFSYNGSTDAFVSYVTTTFGRSLVGVADAAALKLLLTLNNVDNTSDTTKWSATKTLSNTRITRRVATVASSATPAINTDVADLVAITLTHNVTSMTSSLTGTPAEDDPLLVSITSAAAQTIVWGAKFIVGPAPLVTTTGVGKTHELGFRWRAAKDAWVCFASDAVGY